MQQGRFCEQQFIGGCDRSGVGIGPPIATPTDMTVSPGLNLFPCPRKEKGRGMYTVYVMALASSGRANAAGSL